MVKLLMKGKKSALLSYITFCVVKTLDTQIDWGKTGECCSKSIFRAISYPVCAIALEFVSLQLPSTQDFI